MRYAVLLSPQAIARVHTALAGHGSVDVLLDARELLAELASARDECLVVDPAMITPAAAEIVAARLAESQRPFVAFSSVTGGALESSVILARRTAARFVFRGTPNERSALERALLVTPDSALGVSVVAILAENLQKLPQGVRGRVESMFRNGDGPASPRALAAATALARRSLDRCLAEAGFVSARRVIEAARVTAAYRSLTTSRTPLSHVALMLGYKSQRTLDSQLSLFLETTCGKLRASPIPCDEAARRLAVRLTQRDEPTARARRASADSGNRSSEAAPGRTSLTLIGGKSNTPVARTTRAQNGNSQ